MNLGTQIEHWASYWKRVTDPIDVERALERLRWLEEFAFHCGPEITPEMFKALQRQIEIGEKKLAELTFAPTSVQKPQPEQQGRVSR